MAGRPDIGPAVIWQSHQTANLLHHQLVPLVVYSGSLQLVWQLSPAVSSHQDAKQVLQD
jgi:hypothetical protein